MFLVFQVKCFGFRLPGLGIRDSGVHVRDPLPLLDKLLVIPDLVQGLVFKAHRLVYHSTPGWRVINKRRRSGSEGFGFRVPGFGFRVPGSGFRVEDLGFRGKCSPV